LFILVAVWLDWIEDEDRLAQQPDEKQAVLALYERAVKDYLGRCPAALLSDCWMMNAEHSWTRCLCWQ